MAENVDTGNPNFFKTFKGRFQLEPASGHAIDNNVVMLTCTNDVQILGDIELRDYKAGVPFATLPVGCRPDGLVKVPVVITDNDAQVGEEVAALKVGMDGAMFLEKDYASATVWMKAINFSISSCWYKEVL